MFLSARIGLLSWLGLAALLPLVACGASERPGLAPAAIPPWQTPPRSPSSARWVYLPTEPAAFFGQLPLTEGSTELLFGAKGERWVWSAQTSDMQGADELADQDLVAATHPRPDRFWFVGRKGTVYETDSPLGAFRTLRPPPEPVVRADASGGRLLVVTRRGQLLRSDNGGVSFAAASLPAAPFADVALLDENTGMALAYPEALYTTLDGGTTWSPLPARTVGAKRLQHEAAGRIAVVGMQQALLWSPTSGVQVVGALPSPVASSLPPRLGPAPTAQDVRDGHAAMVGENVFLVRPPAAKGASWRLGVAPLGRRMTLVSVPHTEGCSHVAVAAAPTRAVVACSHAEKGAEAARVQLVSYHPARGEFQPLALPLEGRAGEVRLALAADHRLLVTGVCRRGVDRPCEPDTPLLIRLPEAPSSASPPVVVPSEVASFAGRPLAVAVAPQGSLAYLLGRRRKTDELTLFLSRDGGAHFHPLDLSLVPSPAAENAANAAASRPRSPTFASLSVGGEGAVGVVLEFADDTTLVTCDESGYVVARASWPAGFSPAAAVGNWGRRALLVEGGAVAETAEGGASPSQWQPLDKPPAGAGDTKRAVACGSAGCLVGDNVARPGWGGPYGKPVPNDAAPAKEAAAHTSSGTGAARKMAPLVCRPDTTPWQPLLAGSPLPGASDADRGKTAWSVMAADPRHASVSLVQVALAGAPRVTTLPLLPPAARPEEFLLGSAPQIEGGVALRRRVPSAPGAASFALELAWQNLWEGPPAHAVVRDTDLLRDLEAPLSSAPQGVATPMKTNLLSVTANGVFVVPKETGAQLFFIDRQGHVRKTLVPSLPHRALDQESVTLSLEGLATEKKIVPLALLGAWGVLRAGTGTTWDAMAFASPPTTAAGANAGSQITFAYLAGRPHLLSFRKAAPGERSTGRLFPFRAEGAVLGAPVAVPTQGDLTGKEPVCTSEKAATARIVAPAEAGARRPVLLESPDGQVLAGFVSASMVLYGTPSSPCVSVVEATPVDEQGNVIAAPTERLLVMMGDLERSWWFRAGVSTAQPPEARVLRCRVDPQKSVSEAVERALAAGL